MCKDCPVADDATGCSALAALSGRAASGELAALHAQPRALTLCLPAFTAILSAALSYLSEAPKPPSQPSASERLPGNSAGSIPHGQQQTTVAQQWLAVAKVLTDILQQEQLEQQLAPLIMQCFSLQPSTAATHLCIGLLTHMPVLYDRLGLSTYLASFHTAIMHLVVAPDNYSPAAATQGNSQGTSASQAEIAASFARAQLVNAASTALCGMTSSKLTLPVVLEHVIRPLLMALGNSPDVAVALIGVGSAIGGDMAALHLLPSLIMVLVSSSNDSTPARRHNRCSAGTHSPTLLSYC